MHVESYPRHTEQVDKNLEIEKLKHLLAKNDYPKEVGEKEVERFLASKERIERESEEKSKQPHRWLRM